MLGLIFLKYISDAFEEDRALLEADRSQGADPEGPDEYRAVNIFWVRWCERRAEAVRLDAAIEANLKELGLWPRRSPAIL